MSGIGVTNDYDISAADSVTTVFTYSFFAYDASQVKLYSVLDDVETPILSGFTVTPNSDFIGGSITFSVAPAAAVGEILRRREVPYTQTTEFTDLIRYKETGIEKALNTIVMQIQQLASKVSRSMRYSEAAGTTDTTIETPVDGKALIFDGVTGRLVPGPDAADIAGAQGYAADALASKNSAAVSEANAAASATTAQNAVDGIPYRDVVFITSANSPYTINNTNRGKLIYVDTSGGNVTINLSQISSLTMPFTIGVKKSTPDANTVTINRGGTDVIDEGATSYSISSVSGVNLIADTDPTPDKWASAAFGAGTGEVRTQTFTAGVGFTAGVSTTITLTNTPIAPSSSALEVFYDGLAQHPSEWSYNTSTGVITFTEAIPSDVAQIFTRWASSSVVIGTPSAGTVSWSSLASGLIGAIADLVAGTAQKLVDAATFRSWVSTYNTMPNNRAAMPAAVDLTIAVTSGAKKITIWLDDISSTDNTNANTGDFIMQLKNSAYVTTGYKGTAMFPGVSGTNRTDGLPFMPAAGTGGMAANTCSFRIEMVLVDAATHRWNFHATGGSTSTSVGGSSQGTITLSTALTELRLRCANGTATWDAGNYNYCIEV